jgi:pantoate--beta-alanine ligase
MKTIISISEMQNFSERARLRKKTIGLVPTMGYLHEGHVSLIQTAKKSCDLVVTSIFVNPAQFAPNEDFARYPRDIARDKKLCKSAGTAVLFTPEAESMYPKGYSTYITVEGISSVLEGKFRPTHFRGVTTVVAKLFLIVNPDKAFFGRKDAQQCVVIKKLARDLNFGTEIVVAPIVRERDGVAMSSRNIYLSPQEREDATILRSSLLHAETMVKKGTTKTAEVVKEIARLIETKPAASVDYIAVVHAESLTELETFEPGVPALIALAVRIGKTRLIDNTTIILH